MKPLGNAYNTAEVGGDFVALPPGGYVVRITDVEDNDKGEKPYLTITFDIADGEHKGYYGDEWGVSHPWAHNRRQYYNEAAYGVFKSFLKAVDDSNGTNFVEVAGTTGLNERLLINCVVGLVVGLREYETDTGYTRTSPDWFNAKVVSVNAIREGKYTIPALKTAEKKQNAPAGFNVSADEMPF